MPTNPTSRLKRLRQALDTAEASTLLETHLPNIYYLCGFSGDSGALLVDPTSAILFTDGRFTIQAQEETRAIRVHIHKGPLLEAVGEHLRARKRQRVAVSPSRLTLAGWKALRKAAGGNLKWLAIDGLVENLRAVKDAAEIDRIPDAPKRRFRGVLRGHCRCRTTLGVASCASNGAPNREKRVGRPGPRCYTA